MFKKYLIITALLMLVALVLAACGGNTAAPARQPASQATVLSEETHSEVQQPTEMGMHVDAPSSMGDHMGEEAHTPMEHMIGAHAVPEEAMAVRNPVAATQDSIAAGAAIFAQNCAVCHGPDGEGDGPGAAGLEIKPANLNEDHVQDLTDGGLFYIITHGRAGTAMPAWESTLSEEQRWQVVNFIRTFGK